MGAVTVTPYSQALFASLDGSLDHPSVKAGNPASIVTLWNAAGAFALFGCFVRRQTAGSALRGFLSDQTTPPPPDLDHPYTLHDVRDAGPNRIVGIVSEPYRRVDEKFRKELDAWAEGVGCKWGPLPKPMHAPEIPECSAIFICRDFPERLQLTEGDEWLAGKVKKKIEKLRQHFLERLWEELDDLLDGRLRQCLRDVLADLQDGPLRHRPSEEFDDLQDERLRQYFLSCARAELDDLRGGDSDAS